MADNVLKLAPETEAKRKPDAPPAAADAGVAADTPKKSRRSLRFVLLVVIPLIAAVVGLYWYLSGGRYISTDNAYVGMQKVMITPDISGKISKIVVREGEEVKAGQPLFEIDAVPFRIAVTQAQAKLAGVRTDFDNLKTNLTATDRLIDLARQTVALKTKEVERKQSLLASRAGAQADVDSSVATLVNAKTQLEQLIQQQARLRNQLLDDPALPIEKYPPYIEAQAALDQAQRDLAHTTLRAPINGMATQVDSIQLGRYVTAGTPVFAIVDNAHPWVDANPKETDITYLRIGQSVDLTVDTFSNKTFKGTVSSVSPGTGSQFSILPAQNASGNWVKVVQRVPLRITFDPNQDLSRLRAGMSVVVDIDTKRQRSLAGLFGLAATAKNPAETASKP
jgi:membrane fusion protein (multidrug efflux system)